jgi:hypothetical protein
MGSLARPVLPEAFARRMRGAGAYAQRLEELRTAIQGPARAGAVPTTIPELDELLHGGLGRGMVHEWIGVGEPPDDTRLPRPPVRTAHWSPALTLLMELTRSAAASPQDGRDHVVWIGPAVWPYPIALARAGAPGAPLALDRCLFVRATRPADRLWAADLALRSRAVAAVVADGSSFDLAATRRLQLAAEAGAGLCLLARPAWERAELSAAATRWLISRVPSSSMNRRWTVGLLRCKGLQPAAHAQRAWTLERDHATGALRLVPDLRDRPGETEARTPDVRRTG